MECTVANHDGKGERRTDTGMNRDKTGMTGNVAIIPFHSSIFRAILGHRGTFRSCV